MTNGMCSGALKKPKYGLDRDFTELLANYRPPKAPTPYDYPRGPRGRWLKKQPGQVWVAQK